MKTLLLSLCACLLAGCTTYVTDQTDTLPDGTVRHTKLKARSFFDSAAKLAGASATTTDKSQRSALTTLEQSANGSNAVSVLDSAISAAVTAAIRATVKP